MKQKFNSQIRRISKQIMGLTLAHAFVIVEKRERMKLNVSSIDDEVINHIKNDSTECINVNVTNGLIKRSWVS